MRINTQNEEIRGARRFARTRLFAATLMAVSVLAACSSSDDDDDEHHEETPVGETPGETPEVRGPIDVTFLHINDHHSNLDVRSHTLSLANAAGDVVEAKVESAGFARITTAFRELAEGKDNVVKVHAGDALTGTLYFNRAGDIGAADAAMMNTVCFDSFTLGNHEFDKSDTELKNFIDRLHAGECQTPVISANVDFGASSALSAADAEGYVEPYTIVQRGGQNIGIVGLTVAAKTKQSSSPDADTTFREEAAAAQEAIDALKAQGVNKVVIASHIGYALDRQIIPLLSGVDVVLGGDSHTLLGPDVMEDIGLGSPAGAYAEQMTNADGEPVCLGQAWEYGQVLGEMNVSFDIDGVVTSCGGMPHVLLGDTYTLVNSAGVEQPTTDEDRAALLASANAYEFLRVTEPDAGALAVLTPYKAEVEVFSATDVATAPVELCNRRVPGGPDSADYNRSSAACNAGGLGMVNFRGGDIQQLVAQAFLEIANQEYGGADITLQSGGGVRRELHGTVTAANVIEVVPFGNMLYRLQITGAEARAMVEDGLEATFRTGGSTGPYPYTGGMRFHVDATQTHGNRATNFQVRDRVTGLWNPIVDTQTYDLFVLSFNASGGDGYTTLANIPAERRQDIGVLDADVFQTYIDRLPVAPGAELPVLPILADEFYSTQDFIGFE